MFDFGSEASQNHANSIEPKSGFCEIHRDIRINVRQLEAVKLALQQIVVLTSAASRGSSQFFASLFIVFLWFWDPFGIPCGSIFASFWCILGPFSILGGCRDLVGSLSGSWLALRSLLAPFSDPF